MVDSFNLFLDFQDFICIIGCVVYHFHISRGHSLMSSLFDVLVHSSSLEITHLADDSVVMMILNSLTCSNPTMPFCLSVSHTWPSSHTRLIGIQQTWNHMFCILKPCRTTRAAQIAKCQSVVLTTQSQMCFYR